jgi:SAM-dependent methyltransferase
MYGELAGWFHLLTVPEDYVEEAAWAIETLRVHARRPIGSLLELGSGGGNLASNLPAGLDLTLSDRSPDMIEVSRTIVPRAVHVIGDMRVMRLERTFDAVLAHDAIGYMATERDLAAAVATAFVHLRPGGAALFQPDHVLETFRAGTDHGGHDRDGRGLRYLEWTHAPSAPGAPYIVDYAMLLRERDGSVRVISDRHEQGLFAEVTWLRSLRAAGFLASVVTDPWERRVFIGVRDESAAGDDEA